MGINLGLAIEDFWTARSRGEFFPKTYFDRLSIDEAYRIQLALIERRIAAGEQQIGWKVGLTAKAIQEQFGFHEPVFACIMETQQTGHIFGANELILPGFETELCVRLSHGLEGEVGLAQVREAVDVIHPAFEIIETRGDAARQTALLLADNGQQRSIVLGAPVHFSQTLELDQTEVHVALNGRIVASGLGSAVLGNPLNSIKWLAGKLSQYGRRLHSGDLVMTGSFVRQFPLAAGDVVDADFSGIGRVQVGVATL